MSTFKSKRVLVVGSTGLIGRTCLALLAHDSGVAQVIALVRRSISKADLLGPNTSQEALAKLQVRVLDFNNLSMHMEVFNVDAVICALGTTIKQAGSQAAFRQIDHDYPLAIAQLAFAQGVQHFSLVSALGASTASRAFFSRVKGEIENAIANIGFESLTVVRPSLLLGKRAEFRLAESIGTKFACLIPPPWTPVHARQVARALINSIHHPPNGRLLLENMALRQFSAAEYSWQSKF